jgi:hypothetical protein
MTFAPISLFIFNVSVPFKMPLFLINLPKLFQTDVFFHPFEAHIMCFTDPIEFTGKESTSFG